MNVWLVEPRDTLVVRDGRPFVDGAPAMSSLELPWPSSMAGLVRTRLGAKMSGEYTPAEVEKLKEVAVAGPWLVALDPEGSVRAQYFRAPRDVLWHEGALRTRLEPGQLRPGEQTDLAGMSLLSPVSRLPAAKPDPKPPTFWSWTELSEWLAKPPRASETMKEFGRPGLLHERRVHVAIDSERQTARDGMLFGTDGLRFTTPMSEPSAGERLALAFRTAAPELDEGPCFLGGERRVSFLRRAPKSELEKPKLDLPSRRARVVLLTPAIFEEGWAPKSIEGATVYAAAVGRPETISGWNLATRPSRAKPTRRMAGAGSVFFSRCSSS